MSGKQRFKTLFMWIYVIYVLFALLSNHLVISVGVDRNLAAARNVTAGRNLAAAVHTVPTQNLLSAYDSANSHDTIELITGTDFAPASKDGNWAAIEIDKPMTIMCQDTINKCKLDGTNSKTVMKIVSGTSSTTSLIGLEITRGYSGVSTSLLNGGGANIQRRGWANTMTPQSINLLIHNTNTPILFLLLYCLTLHSTPKFTQFYLTYNNSM